MVKEDKNQITIEPLPAEGFARLPQVLHVLGIGKTCLWDGIKEGRFPRPVKISPRVSVWRVEDIRNLINSYAAGSADEE